MKHLRQLNFFHLVTCAALLLAVYLPRDTTLRQAATQLDEVIRFQSEVGDVPIWQAAGAAPPRWYPDSSPAMAILFQRPGETDQRVCFLYSNEIIPGHWELMERDGSTDFRRAETLGEFTAIWDALSYENAFLRITQFSDKARIASGAFNSQVRPTVPVEIIRDQDEVRRLFERAFSLQQENKLIPSIGELVSLSEGDQEKPFTHGFRLNRSLEKFGGAGSFVVPIATEPARVPVLKNLLAQTESDYEFLRANDYSMVHQELYDWSLGGKLDELGLYSLRSVLQSLQVTQGETFPMFGLDIPYDFLFRYGLFALVAIELFLYAHLRSLRMLTSGHFGNGWAQWMPLFPSRICRSLTVLKYVVLPILVIVQLLVASEPHGLSIVAGVSGIIVSLGIFYEFWRLWRPGNKRVQVQRQPIRQAA